jgi:hypothetical protein
MESKKPVISVILTTQLDSNAPYLHLALKGLAATKGVQYEVFVVSGTHIRPECPELYRPEFNLIWDQSLDTATKKVERAFRSLSPHSTHIMHLSDDVIVNAHTLADLHRGFKGREMIVNPLSNSDCRSVYELDLYINGQLLTHDMVLGDLEPETIDELIQGREDHSAHCLVRVPSVCFYCTMITRSIYDKIGHLDAKLEYQGNDIDFCLRAAQKGIPSCINFCAFAFHFGSRTLSQMDSDHVKRDAAAAHFKTKWKAS